jgi:hypothetical protein
VHPDCNHDPWEKVTKILSTHDLKARTYIGRFTSRLNEIDRDRTVTGTQYTGRQFDNSRAAAPRTNLTSIAGS